MAGQANHNRITIQNSSRQPVKHKLPLLKKTIFALTAFLTLSACGNLNNFETLPSFDEIGNEGASLPSAPPTVIDPGGGTTPVAASQGQKMILNQNMILRYEVNNILESKYELPAGTQIEVPADYQIKNLDYRTSDGTTTWSSTGFLTPLKIISAPASAAATLTAAKIKELNQVVNLYISASVVGAAQGISGDFATLAKASPSTAGFQKYYADSGKPSFNFLSSVNKRFSVKLNKGVSTSSQSVTDVIKFQSIYDELRKAADRTKTTPKSLLMIDLTPAKQWSLDYEKLGVVSPNGAWTIATEATAVRHGFENVPCAEFMSEMVREAYQRAGYRASDDFNDARGNPLIWSNSAAVVAFSSALYTAGWIPWDPRVYRPITGSLLMHGSGLSPGHTYISAGADGRFIVDNGYPQGRDLGKATDATIEMMYQTGVFFLPPGINPPVW